MSSSNSDLLDASMAAIGELVAQLDMEDVEGISEDEAKAKGARKPKTRKEKKGRMRVRGRRRPRHIYRTPKSRRISRATARLKTTSAR